MEEKFLKERGIEYLKLKEAELNIRKGLPHLYGFKWYRWALDFFETKNKLAFLTAGNQCSKSSTQIRKMINWATDDSLWPELWPGETPNQFWYLYPTQTQCSVEFETKWKQFLPRGDFKSHPKYGWRDEWKNKEIFAIHFNSGISIFFKSYKQGADALQTGTVYYVGCDEEIPEELWDELNFRVQAVNGYISSVFTATIGQEIWRKTIEPKNKEEEKFPQAFKRQVSLYDCQKYADGTPSKWTDERINQVIATCRSPQEVQKRVYGRFVKEEGLVYPTFSIERHMKPWHPVPDSWGWYSAVDMGSGGSTGHPAGIVFIAVRPDYKLGRVVASWRGDNIRTTASDVLLKYLEMEKALKITPMMRIYDWASAEFGEIAARNGVGFIKADKSHVLGEQVINTLFRNDMMAIYDASENGKLAGELCTISIGTAKRVQEDNLVDPFRYCCVKIPWNWEGIGVENFLKTEEPEKKLSRNEAEIAERRRYFEEKREEESLQDEFDTWNQLYNG